jgi:CubicO group peptidase (beta-lactamase class C family)
MQKFISAHKVMSVLAVVVTLILLIVIYLDLHLLLFPMPKQLDEAIEQQMRAAKIPGAAVAVVKDGEIVFAEGYGYADPVTMRPVTPDTLFTIASVSKTVTGTALMELYEQGQFDLDEDINRYLPFPVRNPSYPGDMVTFRMLLTHTSSIIDSAVYDSSYTLISGGDYEDSPISLENFLVDYFSKDGQYYDAKNNYSKNKPGTTYQYSNIGFGLAAYLVEQISGMPFDVFCKEEIFVPLGMYTTGWFFRDIDKDIMAVPTMYTAWNRAYKRVGFYGYPTYTDGALKTSVNEYARFLSLFLPKIGETGQTNILQPETVAEMLKIQFDDKDTQIGLVWHLTGNTYQHSGGDPGISTITAFNPKKNLGIIVFTNGDSSADILNGIRSSVFLKRIVLILSAAFTN